MGSEMCIRDRYYVFSQRDSLVSQKPFDVIDEGDVETHKKYVFYLRVVTHQESGFVNKDQCFSATGRTYNADELAPLDVQIHPRQGVYLAVSHPVDLPDVPQPDHDGYCLAARFARWLRWLRRIVPVAVRRWAL